MIHCSPQAVFKVRPATRCSSTLSGEASPLLVSQHNSDTRLPGHTSPILCASFSPTGNLLATGSGDCNARLWDLFTETPSHTLSGHKGWVLCVEWEALERKLATGGHDGHVCSIPSTCRGCLGNKTTTAECVYLFQVRLWDPKTGKPIGDALKGHTKWVTSLSWEPIHL